MPPSSNICPRYYTNANSCDSFTATNFPRQQVKVGWDITFGNRYIHDYICFINSPQSTYMPHREWAAYLLRWGYYIHRNQGNFFGHRTRHRYLHLTCTCRKEAWFLSTLVFHQLSCHAWATRWYTYVRLTKATCFLFSGLHKVCERRPTGTENSVTRSQKF